MWILLLLAQVVLWVLAYPAHVLHHVSPWLIWLPSILMGVLLVITALLGGGILAVWKKLG